MSLAFQINFTLRALFRYALGFPTQRHVRREKPLHIVFATVDHYEPGTGNVSEKIECERVDRLLRKYPELASRHADNFGNLPRRTWFFPPHYHRYFSLKKLVSLCEAGYGEIELHYHHGKAQPDTAENLKKGLRLTVDEYGQFGVFGTEKGVRKYAFIHGDWALNNSRGGRYCGVNDEITVLLKTGCYADFTFPSLNPSNPAQINSIFYARSQPNRPKGHNAGPPIEKNGPPRDGLLLIQGPVYPFFKTKSPAGLRLFGDAIDGDPPVTPKRIARWIATGIHVKGVPNVIFVKTHTHGAAYESAVLGDEMDFILDFLETRFSDGEQFLLHYTTAREMYNMIKALEAGKNPAQLEKYRNFRIQEPVYDSSPQIESASETLQRIVCSTYCD